MRIGKAIDHSHEFGVVPPNMPNPRKTNLRYGLLAIVPASILLGAALAGRKKETPAKPSKGKADI